jgi:hypothetical protein
MDASSPAFDNACKRMSAEGAVRGAGKVDVRRAGSAHVAEGAGPNQPPAVDAQGRKHDIAQNPGEFPERRHH